VTYILLSIQKVCFYVYYTESFTGKAGAAVQLSDHKCLVEANKVSSLQFVFIATSAENLLSEKYVVKKGIG
jgi:hypothetical protein